VGAVPGLCDTAMRLPPMDVKRMAMVLSCAVLRGPGENQGQGAPAVGREGIGEPITQAGGQFLLRPEATEFKRGDLLSARYQIEKIIGRGATGCVLQAFDRVVRTVVAVKIMRPDLASDPRWVERLGGELRYARKLQHPNVCRVFDVGESEGHHFLTIEFASRGSLRQRLAERGAATRSWDERIADARAVIDGLCAIHAENIIHRDVKPENVLVMDDGRLVVTDFGVAVALGSTTYFSSQVAGTPSYMAPEVIMGEKATAASDVFSLGITLHEILFGRRPEWQITAQGKTIKSPVGSKAPLRDRAFASLILECLTEFAPKRLQDAAAVKRSFEQAVGGRLHPLRGRLRGRWPLVVGALAVSAAAVTVALGMRHRLTEPSPAASVATSNLVGKPVDLSVRSRSLVTTNKRLTCFDLLPGGTAVRLVWGEPAEAVDLDLATGRDTRAPLAAETYKTECPRLSPDGRKVLYTASTTGGPHIMLSAHPDGTDAQMVTEGSSPLWLPSSNEFVYSFDRTRGGVFSLPGTRQLFPDSPPLEKHILDMAVSAAGDRIAFLFVDGRQERMLEVYSYPSMSLVTTARYKKQAYFLAFDSRRSSLLVTVADTQSSVLTELTASGDLERLAIVEGALFTRAARSKLGLAFYTTQYSRALVARSPDGSERTFRYSSAYSRPVFSEGRSALLETRLDDGRTVISLQRWGDRESRPLTSGPEDGYPSFGPGGNSFVYVRVDRNTVMGCTIEPDGTANCRPITTDALGPRHSVVSPDGSAVAYQTVYGAGKRMRIVPISGGQARDLGNYSSDCSLVWSSRSGISLYDNERREWREIDSVTGNSTGRTHPVPTATSPPCEEGPRYGAATPPRLELRSADTMSFDVRIAADL
jgi:hypothetical protein